MKKKVVLIVSISLVALIAIGFVGYRYLLPAQFASSDFMDDGEIFGERVGDLMMVQESHGLFSGKVEPEKNENIYYDPEKGAIKEVFVEEGDEIDEETPLFEYELNEDIDDERDQLQLQLDLAYLQINESEKKKQKLDKSIKNAVDDEEKEMLEEERAQLDFELRQLNLEAAQTKKQLDRLVPAEEEAIVMSKSSGIVQSINQDLVEGMQGEAMNSPFIQVVSTGSYLVKSQVNEFILDTLEVDMPVKITKKTGGDEEWVGVITDIGKIPVGSDQNDMGYDMYDSNPQSSNYPFTVRIDEHEGLEIGFHVNIEPVLHDEEGGTVVLFEEYVQFDDDGQAFVWVADENLLTAKRFVETGASDPENFTIEIVDGLTEDDIIVGPSPSLEEGREVMMYDDFLE
ncbi:efflux RND transporter periplasmic adaptor subunit [Halalkalibacterium halodurans]|uniref:efflux RND transporter periplasmic adaptor subunit n=1 Tax=Halalkalibacterium halodurans TaxID=86665 RepID=UPI002E1B9CFB|nr:efflux RND transporter periplasmic adaptor subunit [Halalkalibacterium halodurans]